MRRAELAVVVGVQRLLEHRPWPLPDQASLEPATLLPRGCCVSQASAAAMVGLMQLPSLPSFTFSSAATSCANIIVVLSLLTLLNHQIA